MNLTRRIGRLEVVHADTLHACTLCGGLDPLNPGLVITRHDRALEACPECGLHLDEDGRPLPPVYKRIILPHDAPEDVP